MYDSIFPNYKLFWVKAKKENSKFGRAKGGMLIAYHIKLANFVQIEMLNDKICLKINKGKQMIRLLPVYLSCTSWSREYWIV